MYRLPDAEAWIAYNAAVERKTDEALIVRLRPLKEMVADLRLHPVNRGFNSIIDATVHATRYVMTGDPWLRKLIDHHASLVRKCGGTREWEALDLLLGYLDRAETGDCGDTPDTPAAPDKQGRSRTSERFRMGELNFR